MPEQVAVDDAARAAEIKTAESAAGEAAKVAERQRVAELIRVGDLYGAVDLAREAINAGDDVGDLNKKILERGGLELIQAEDPNIGLTPAETRKFSFVKFLNALANPDDKQAREAAAFEIECSVAAARVAKTEAKGFMVPFDVLTAQRDLLVGTDTAGGHLVSTELLTGSFIDRLENAMALVRCGVTMLPGLVGNIAIPRQTSGATGYWVAENGAPTESQPAFDQIAMTPKTVGAYTEISRRLLKQSSLAIESFVQNDLALRLALAIDLAGIAGTGTGDQPTGIINYTGVGLDALGTNGLAPTWDDVVNLESGVAEANADVGAMCYLSNAKVRGKFKRTFIDAGSGERLWDSRAGDTPVNGYRQVTSNQVPSNLTKGSSVTICSAIIFGNFADLIIGMWGGLDVTVNPHSLDTTGAVRVVAFQDIDIQIRHALSFNTILDALTT